MFPIKADNVIIICMAKIIKKYFRQHIFIL